MAGKYIVIVFGVLSAVIIVFGLFATEETEQEIDRNKALGTGAVRSLEVIKKCKKDIRNTCGAFSTPDGQVACLKEHYEELSGSCRKVIDQLALTELTP